jgi:hypothetical protein
VSAEFFGSVAPLTMKLAPGSDWSFSRDDLIASHGADHPMPNLLDRLAAPDCPRLGSNWDRCGVHYVEPIK